MEYAVELKMSEPILGWVDAGKFPSLGFAQVMIEALEKLGYRARIKPEKI